MSVRNLSRILGPERVAVIGASDDPSSVGAIVLDNLVTGGFEGIVNPVTGTTGRCTASRSMRRSPTCPKRPTWRSCARPPPRCLTSPRDCGEAGVPGVVIISAGFRERGDDGAELERRVGEVAGRYHGLRLLGPNCLGLLVPARGLNASFARARPRDGNVALVSQSGALVTSVLDWAQAAGPRVLGRGVGREHARRRPRRPHGPPRPGLAHALPDPLHRVDQRSPQVHVGRAGVLAHQAHRRLQGGRFAASAAAAVSHSGAMAGADDVYDAALRRAGIVRVDAIDEVFDAVELLAGGRHPRGPRLAVVTNAGGPGVMAAESTLLARGGELATSVKPRAPRWPSGCRPRPPRPTPSTCSATPPPSGSRRR